MTDRVTHPTYYQRLPVEAWDICKHYGFIRGNALKYLLRAGNKTEQGLSDIDKTIEDLNKAKAYIDKEIEDLRATADF